MYIFVHVWHGVINKVNIGENLEALKRTVIRNFLEEGFDPDNEEAEIRNDQNERVFSFNQYYTLWTMLQEYPFPFFDVRYLSEDDENFIFSGNIKAKEKSKVEIRVKTEIDHLGVYYKKEGEEEVFYENIYHI